MNFRICLFYILYIDISVANVWERVVYPKSLSTDILVEHKETLYNEFKASFLCLAHTGRGRTWWVLTFLKNRVDTKLFDNWEGQKETGAGDSDCGEIYVIIMDLVPTARVV